LLLFVVASAVFQVSEKIAVKGKGEESKRNREQKEGDDEYCSR